MRVLIVSWEYPPLVVGGLGRHVAALTRELAAAGHDICVVTRGEASEVTDSGCDGARIVRAAVDPLQIDFTTETLLAWTQASEHALVRAALPVLASWRPDVVHAHDWLVAQSAITLARSAEAPLVTTMHATESGRHQGRLAAPLNRAIHSVERWLSRSSAEVITCSPSMRDEVTGLFDLDGERVTVVPNGIDAGHWRSTVRQRAAVRDRHASDGPLLVFAGRLMHEKGVQTLLETIRPLRAAHPGLRLAVAGTGLHEKTLHARARALRIVQAVDWLGYVAEDELPALLGAADAVVVPSWYEPFGIVALEAAAAGAPLVVAQTGGLRDLASAGLAAASVPPGDAAALEHGIGKLLADPEAAVRSARKAQRTVRRDYAWDAVATRTVQVYGRAAG